MREAFVSSATLLGVDSKTYSYFIRVMRRDGLTAILPMDAQAVVYILPMYQP
jgi:hypothetical protein